MSPGGAPPSPSTVCDWQRLDIYSLGSTLDSVQRLKSVSQLQGSDAAAVIEVLDRALDLPDIGAARRKMYTVALRKLCGGCGILPKSYTLTDGLEIASHEPYAFGGFGDVWEGRYNGSQVAIKTLKTCATDDIVKVNKRFCKEVLIWKRLSHPNILPFIGVSTSPFRFCMVSVWMTHGNIIEYITANPQANRLALLSDVASGLSYLHMTDLVHGDLKGANILINRDLRACLADFGLMKVVSDPQDRFSAITSASGGGTVRWMAPELLNPDMFGFDHDNPSKESDVYAMGMVIFEVMTGSVPFCQYGNLKVGPKVVNGIRPEYPMDAVLLGLSDTLWQMVELCWHQKWDERPTIGLVLDHLTEASRDWNPLPQKPRNSFFCVDEGSDASSRISDFFPRTELREFQRFPAADDISMTIKNSSVAHDIPNLMTNKPRIIVPDNVSHKLSVHSTPVPLPDPTQSPSSDSLLSTTAGSPPELKQPATQRERSTWRLRGAHTEGTKDGIEDATSPNNLREKFNSFRQAFIPPKNEKLAFSLTENGTSLINRFERTHKVEDLEKAITCYRRALDLRPSGHPDRSDSLCDIARAIRDRFKGTHKLEDLEEAIVYLREALELCPRGAPNRWSTLNNLACVIHDRFQRSHKLEDLEAATAYDREALDLCPPGNPNRSRSLHNLACAFHSRFRLTHKLKDLEEAIAYHREAINLCPPSHPNRPTFLSNLGHAICDRSSWSHKLEDSEEAISYINEALDRCPPGHPGRSYPLKNIARAILRRFEQSQKPEDLAKAMTYSREALDLCPSGHPARCASLNIVARSVRHSFEQSRNSEDLVEAIAYLREALVLCPPGHLDWFDSLVNLAAVITMRFNQTTRMEDLREAEKLLSDAEAAMPIERPMHIQLEMQNLRQKINQLCMSPNL